MGAYFGIFFKKLYRDFSKSCPKFFQPLARPWAPLRPRPPSGASPAAGPSPWLRWGCMILIPLLISNFFLLPFSSLLPCISFVYIPDMVHGWCQICQYSIENDKKICGQLSEKSLYNFSRKGPMYTGNLRSIWDRQIVSQVSGYTAF